MTRIWRMDFRFEVALMLAKAGPDGRLPIDITHHVYRDEMRNFIPGLPMGGMKRLPSLAVDLALTKEDFDFDYFTWAGAKFASERMRKAMGLNSSEVKFFRIDDSRSALLPRSKKYRLMEALAREDVADLEKVGCPELEAEMRLLSSDMPLRPTFQRLVIRQDCAPTHDLFYDNALLSDLLCTEAFASRILKAGCTGMTFTDPNSFGGGGRLFRTARGIEKEVEQDPLSSAVLTELVQAID